MELKKELRLIDVIAISTGAMISSGIFILPGLAFARTGPSIFISYFLAGLLALSGGLSISEMATAMPKAGGDYFFINRALGSLVGTVSGLLSWFALSLKSAFAIIGISELLFVFFQFDVRLSAVIICLFFVILNISGVKEAGRFQVILFAFLVIILAGFVGLGFFEMDLSRLKSLFEHGFNSMLTTAGFVFISFGGLLKVASISEEVSDPKRNIPRGIIFSVILVMILYTFILIVTVGVLNPGELSGSLTPIADAAKNVWNQPGFIIITIASLLAFVTTANAGILSASRYPLALSRDNLLPKVVSRVNKRFYTPVISIVLTGTFIVASMLLQLEVLIKAASTIVILNYILSNLSIIILRESKLENYRPSFKAPLYPWIQIISITAFILLIVDMGPKIILISLGAILIGIIVYYIYGKRHATGDYALLNIVKRVANRELKYTNLENELKGILMTRDNICTDFFDELIDRAGIMDIEERMGHRRLFDIIAESIAGHNHLKSDNVLEKLRSREHESSTVINHFVAIPHIIIPGEDAFELIVIRSSKGIEFPDGQIIHAVFALAGTMSRRNLHLKSLAAIAQIIQNESFEPLWLNAKSTENLRDILHLARRKRFRENN
ncbi:MAG: amino acid permease [candidate division WOR-3 bacterium]|nr:amino acid permease [candidate division WOR-3 bacterium]